MGRRWRSHASRCSPSHAWRWPPNTSGRSAITAGATTSAGWIMARSSKASSWRGGDRSPVRRRSMRAEVSPRVLPGSPLAPTGAQVGAPPRPAYHGRDHIHEFPHLHDRRHQRPVERRDHPPARGRDLQGGARRVHRRGARGAAYCDFLTSKVRAILRHLDRRADHMGMAGSRTPNDALKPGSLPGLLVVLTITTGLIDAVSVLGL